MKITKYPQSCLVIERHGKRIVIDPGSLLHPRFGVADVSPVDAILITHEHSDHVDVGLLKEIVDQNREVQVVANKGTANILGSLVTKVIEDGESITIGDVAILAKELPHCLMVDGTAGPQNTGYIVDGALFHPGDGVHVEGLSVPVAAVPAAGPDISPKDVIDFIRELDCRTVIPIHYDVFAVNRELMARSVQTSLPGVEFLIIDNGETVEIP